MSTKEQVLEEMKKHDWTYNWSDDHRVWALGSAHKAKILLMAMNAGMTKEELLAPIIEKFGADDAVTNQWREDYGIDRV